MSPPLLQAPGADLSPARLPPAKVKAIVAWTVVTPCVLWTLIRVLGLDGSFPLAAVIAYTPYVIPVALLATAVAAFLRQWIPAASAAVAAAILIVLVAPRAIGEDTTRSGTPVRVMTANVLHGDGDPEQLLEIVRERRVDVLALQELTPKFVARFEELGIRDELPHAVLADREGVLGSGVYSRFPARSAGAGKSHFLQTRATLAPQGEFTLDVTSVHPVPPTGRNSVVSWRTTLRALPKPDPGSEVQLLLGDFNATLDHSEFRKVLDRGYADAGEQTGGGLAATWPAQDKPFRFLPVTIDHLLYEREGIGARDYRVLDIKGSDHRAVYAELVIGS